MSKIKKYTIIGDIHARTNWRQLVEPFDENTIYVFVGDFTDPYYGSEEVTYDQMMGEIKAIFKFAEEHQDNVKLLYGNHDIQYILGKAETSRYDYVHHTEIERIFKDNKELFSGVAYCIDNKYLITHAGVTYDWYTKHCDINFNNDNYTLSEICNNINGLWNSGVDGMTQFTFRNCVSKLSDHYGECTTHSPIWVRPYSLWQNNLLGFESGKIQIVGHTPFESPDVNVSNRIGSIGTLKNSANGDEIDSGLYILDGLDKCSIVNNDKEHVDILCVDCLHTETACVDINAETLEWEKYKIK